MKNYFLFIIFIVVSCSTKTTENKVESMEVEQINIDTTKIAVTSKDNQPKTWEEK